MLRVRMNALNARVAQRVGALDLVRLEEGDGDAQLGAEADAGEEDGARAPPSTQHGRKVTSLDEEDDGAPAMTTATASRAIAVAT